jgi:hypothetical protein
LVAAAASGGAAVAAVMVKPEKTKIVTVTSTYL